MSFRLVFPLGKLTCDVQYLFLDRAEIEEKNSKKKMTSQNDNKNQIQ